MREALMNFLLEYPDDWQIPLAAWIDSITDWLIAEGGPIWDALSSVLLVVVVRAERLLLWLPWSVMILIFFLLAASVVGRRLAAGLSAGFVVIAALGMWEPAMATLAMVLVATAMSVLIGIPVGILMSRYKLVNRSIRPVLDLMQTLPSFVYLIPAVMIFSIGRIPALLATLVYAVPPVIRLTNLGIRQTAPDVVEASRSMGSTYMQTLLKIQLPLALPSIMAGVNQTVMMALAMVVIASMIGAGGLGVEVLRGIGRLEVGRGFVGGICIVLLAVIIDRLTQQAMELRGESHGS